MARGPDKQFLPEAALDEAMLLFWEKGYAATSMADLQGRMGLGAKSLYDTFGNKRQLYFSAIQRYTDTVTKRLFGNLSDRNSPMSAANAVIGTIARLNATEHKGCLLGVAMAQAQLMNDQELAAFLEAELQVIEDALFENFERAKAAGELGERVDSRDMARLYTAAFQGASLISRVKQGGSFTQGVGRALETLTTLSAKSREATQ